MTTANASTHAFRGLVTRQDQTAAQGPWLGLLVTAAGGFWAMILVALVRAFV